MLKILSHLFSKNNNSIHKNSISPIALEQNVIQSNDLQKRADQLKEIGNYHFNNSDHLQGDILQKIT
jgi:hypothetical protein